MEYKGYDIAHYEPGLLDGVLELMDGYWGKRHKENLAFFNWKYISNPNSANPMCGVILHNNKIIGFRGMLSSRWQVTGAPETFNIFSTSDLYIHPEHRLKGLAVKMMQFLMETYANRYRFLLALTVSPDSFPVGLKSGYLPLTEKVYLNRAGFSGLLAFLTSSTSTKTFNYDRASPGSFGPIEISWLPRPEEMATVIRSQVLPKKKITMVQDLSFFEWRYNNPKMKYLFFYYKAKSKIIAYMVFRVNPNRGRGYLVDFASGRKEALEEVIEFIMRNKIFNVMSIASYTRSEQLTGILKKFILKKGMIKGLMTKSKYTNNAAMIRPSEKKYSETDFFIKGIDTRNIDNWCLKEICSDGA